MTYWRHVLPQWVADRQLDWEHGGRIKRAHEEHAVGLVQIAEHLGIKVDRCHELYHARAWMDKDGHPAPIIEYFDHLNVGLNHFCGHEESRLNKMMDKAEAMRLGLEALAGVGDTLWGEPETPVRQGSCA